MIINTHIARNVSVLLVVIKAGESHVLDVGPLDERHRRGITDAGTKFGNAAVSTLAVFACGSNFLEQLLGNVLLAEKRDSLTASV